MADMVDLKRSKQEREKAKSVTGPSEDRYPWGLRVDLGREEMDKLGMKDMPNVGDKVHLHSHAHVVSASEHHSEGDEKPTRRVSLELRKMAIKKPKAGHVEDGTADGMKSAMDSALED